MNIDGWSRCWWTKDTTAVMARVGNKERKLEEIRSVE